jgi:adenylate cyclase
MLAPDLTRLRLWTGLVLFLFAATHLANHALGLISLDAMETGRGVFLDFWRTPPAELALLLSFLLHAGLALLEAVAAPLAAHAAGRAGAARHRASDPALAHHPRARHRRAAPARGRCATPTPSSSTRSGPAACSFMTTLVALVWLHGCIGMHRWLRLKPWYRRLRAPALVLALLLPVLAVLGTVSGGRDYAQRKAADPAWAEALAREQRWPSAEVRERLVYVPERRIVEGFQWFVLLIFAARGLRWLVERRRNVRLTYPGGRVVSVPRGLSVLEASRARGIPHASVCGGRGRCSTCRVRVGKGAAALPPPRPRSSASWRGSRPLPTCGWPASSGPRTT